MARNILILLILGLWLVVPVQAQTKSHGLPPGANATMDKTQDEDRPTWREFWSQRPRRFRVTLGGFVPSRSLRAQSASSSWTAFSISWDSWRPTTHRPFTIATYLDGAITENTVKDQFQSPHDEMWGMYGLGMEMRSYVAPAKRFSLYSGMGAGGYLIRRTGSFDKSSLQGTEVNQPGDKNNLRLGFKLLAGVEERHGAFFEMRYFDAGSVDGARYNGVTGVIGGRF